MKPKASLRRFLAIAGAAALTIPYAQAAHSFKYPPEAQFVGFFAVPTF